MDAVNLGLSIMSMLVGGFLGWRLAASRNRNPTGWMVAGIIFPPLILIVLFLKPIEGASDTEDAGQDSTA